MSRRLRPSLKDYLKTGEVRLEGLPDVKTANAAGAPDVKAANAAEDERIRAFLELLSEPDRQMWEPILRSGTEIQWLPPDLVALREDFRLMDRTRFTYYLLDEKNAPLRPVRTSVQIRGPFVLLLKWDERGTLAVYTDGLDEDMKKEI
jgi:hypothetical protein